MRIIETKIYQFDELTEAAKQKAIEWARDIMTYDPAGCHESLQSIKAFCEHFQVELENWSVDAYGYYFNACRENDGFRGLKLSQFTGQEMPTGYCLDCSLWETFYKMIKETGDAKRAFNDALDAGFKAWRDDLASQLEDDYLIDFIQANEYEFTEKGKIYD